MQAAQNPLIVTLRLDAKSQAIFDELRERYFPARLNYLKAHSTLFHHLPDDAGTWEYFSGLSLSPFMMKVSGLWHLGAGVAYVIDSAELLSLRRKFAQQFESILIPQDRQPFKPHITIQNKVSPEVSKALLLKLNDEFMPFDVLAVGLDVWEYLGGPWRHCFGIDFEKDRS